MYINKGANNITLKQLELMAHTIGFSRDKIKYNKYRAYRNYFSISKGCDDYLLLHSLSENGFMIERECNMTCGGILFHVTEKGLKVFETLFDCKIDEVD